jgi:G3E family GTPase
MTQRVPTNIITGFLGTGKTTTILNLLKQKPDDQNWAILVNEFGEIGIDGTILSGQGAIIKEVPGGCMCCASGVPMSVAVTALLRQKPDRLLIEPTGLGHPKEVIAVLTGEQYLPYIELKATVTLLDPRHLRDEKYTTNQTFNDQLACADVVIGNKIDRCAAQDIDQFHTWLSQQYPPKISHQLVRYGEFPLEMLDINAVAQPSAQFHAHHHAVSPQPLFQLAPEQQYIRKENSGDGYHSCGWIFGAECNFCFDILFSLFSELSAERIKATIHTDRGYYSFNVNEQIVSVHELSLETVESRIEVIDSQPMPWDELEQILLRLAGISK